MMVVQRTANVFEVTLTGAPAPRHRGDYGAADFLSSLETALEGFLAPRDAGYAFRGTAEASSSGSEGTFERRGETSVTAGGQSPFAPREIREEAFRADAAAADKAGNETVRQEVVGPVNERPAGARQNGARVDAAVSDDRRSGASNFGGSEPGSTVSGNRYSTDVPGFEPKARALQGRHAVSAADNGRRAGTRIAGSTTVHGGDTGGASGGTLSAERTASAIRSTRRQNSESFARSKGGERPERPERGAPPESGARGAGAHESERFLSALRRTAENAFNRVKRGEGGNEAEERGSDGPAKGRAATREQRGHPRNALENPGSDVRAAKSGGEAGVSSISAKRDAAENADGKGDGASARTGNENRGNFGEISLAAAKYESTSQRVSSAPDYQIARNTDEYINEIVRQLTLVARKGGGEARISLKPDFLGGMKLNLKLDHGEVSSFILVENPAVKDLIMSKLNVLEQGLLQHGFSLGSFQVEVKDGGGGARAEGQDDGKRAEASIGTGRVEEAVETAAFAPAGLPWMSTIVNITV